MNVQTKINVNVYIAINKSEEKHTDTSMLNFRAYKLN